jgi:hypothetical protein
MKDEEAGENIRPRQNYALAVSISQKVLNR